MSLMIRIVKSLLCIVIALFGATSLAQSQDTVLTIHAVNYPPYEIENTGSDGLLGFDVEVVVEAFKRVGQTAKVEYRPWERVKVMAKRGATLAMLSCAITEARKQYINYSDPISTTTRTYVAPRDFSGDVPRVIDDGKGFKVLAVAGYGTEYELDKANVAYYPAKSDESALKVLLSRNYDFFYSSREYIQYVAAGLEVVDKIQYFDLQQSKNYHLCFSRKWPNSKALHDMFNKGLAEIRADGTYDAIHAKYK